MFLLYHHVVCLLYFLLYTCIYYMCLGVFVYQKPGVQIIITAAQSWGNGCIKVPSRMLLNKLFSFVHNSAEHQQYEKHFGFLSRTELGFMDVWVFLSGINGIPCTNNGGNCLSSFTFEGTVLIFVVTSTKIN